MLNETRIPRLYKNTIVQVGLLLFLVLCEVAVVWLKVKIDFVNSDLILAIVLTTAQLLFFVMIIGLSILLIRFVFTQAHKPAGITENDVVISERNVADILRSFFGGITWIVAFLFSLLVSIFFVNPEPARLFLARVNQYMLMLGFNEPIFAVDIIQLNPNRKKGESNMSKMWKFITEYGERFSTTFVYVIFVLVSLLVAVILFGALQSTGVMKVVLAGYVREAEFGGAFAGFLVMLIFLIRGYNHAVQEKLVISGNVYSSDNSPVKGAIVSITGDERWSKTNDRGWFQINVNEQNSWDIVVESKDKTITKTIRRSRARKPVVIKFPK